MYINMYEHFDGVCCLGFPYRKWFTMHSCMCMFATKTELAMSRVFIPTTTSAFYFTDMQLVVIYSDDFCGWNCA